jgi:methionyl-tRNA formyltransferase
MVWWAEPDAASLEGKQGRPGEILSMSPLIVATGDGAIELSRTEWRGEPVALAAGQLL